MEKKKVYEAPKVKRVRLDIKSAVLGYCQMSTGMSPGEFCQDVMINVCSTNP